MGIGDIIAGFVKSNGPTLLILTILAAILIFILAVPPAFREALLS